MLYLVYDAWVRDAVTKEMVTSLAGQQVQIVYRDTTTPAVIVDAAGDPIPDSLLTVTALITTPRFWIDTTSPADLYLDWYDAGSGARGPVDFDAVLRDAALAAQAAAEAALGTADATLGAAQAAPIIRRTLDYTIQAADPDLWSILDGAGDTIMALNEWGGLRGYPRAYPWFDALVRAILVDGQSGAGIGNALEVEDRRTGRLADRLWGVRWLDGRMVQGDQLVGATYTLNLWETLDDVPASLPPGTLIAQKGD